MYSYCRLTFGAESGNIARGYRGDCQIYRRGIGWEPFPMLTLYFAPYDNNPYYDGYEDMTEAEAMKAIRELEAS